MGGKVIITGSVNVDIVSRAERLPVAGETVSGGDLAVLLGGKGANQAVAAAQAGADAALIGAVGAQSFGLDPLAILRGFGVKVGGVKTLDGPTGAALITVDAEGENQITVSSGANARFGPDDVGAMKCDVALAQMETPVDATIAAFRAAKDEGALTVLNAAPALPVSDGLFALTDVLIVNETELAVYAAMSAPISAAETSGAIEAAMRAARHHPDQKIIATLGAAGAMALLGDEIITVAAAKADAVVDTTGAGDCFCGVLAALLAEGAALKDAMRHAAAAASLAVEVEGAAPAMPARAAIDRRLNR